MIGSSSTGIRTSSLLRQFCSNVSFISEIKLNNVNEALSKDNWVMAMHDKLRYNV